MSNVKEVGTPLSQSFKLSKSQAPKSKHESLEMDQIPYASVVGSIMYIMICTRPDLSHALSVTSKYMSDPGKEHWSALKWVLRYLKGSSSCGILFKRCSKVSQEGVVGYCDADYATNLDNRKSQSRYLFTLFGSVVSWKSSLQSVVALSTTEAEYMALTSAVKESFWIQGVAADFGIVQETVPLFCENSSAICLAQHQYFHERSKHIDVRLHFIRDKVENGRVKVVRIDTLHNPAHMFIKVLGRDKFEHCKELILVCKKD
ncbi:secreted RxLR effector protein 161-like [Salvia splendens]|uniref:secreted RxLR effector protein 161-like n=1 Tax=Salvia splendens TaxID=180675 RepID=UPI001C265119|nr:secreted RxLR effector protein 161-like [Salvia splendens]